MHISYFYNGQAFRKLAWTGKAFQLKSTHNVRDLRAANVEICHLVGKHQYSKYLITEWVGTSAGGLTK